MEGIFRSDVGHRVRDFLPDDGLSGAERPRCSPCEVMFSERPLDPSADIPYDTERCDAKCVGKWAVALRRLAMYTLEQVHEAFDRVAQALGITAAQLSANVQGNMEVLLKLEAGGQTYRFQMQSDGQGHLSWEGALAQKAKKDGKLSIYVALGNGGTTTVDPSMGALRDLQSRLPPLRLDKYDIELSPLFRRVGNLIHMGFTSKELPVRMYSKHRAYRGDDHSQPWVSYIDPETKREWQYRSGLAGKRHARWEGVPSLEV